MRAGGYELVETHISRVLLGPEDVYKIKKPVDLGFLDFTTLEKRRLSCQAEVALNRRLAPDVYLATLPLILDSAGAVAIGSTSDKVGIVEWMVHMRRLPDHERADVMLRDGRLGRAEIAALGRVLARFHGSCQEDEHTRQLGSYETIRGNVAENFEQTKDVIGAFVDEATASEIESWQAAFLESRRDLFETRVRQGHVRDGHGDLRLEHVYFASDPSSDCDIAILDCIEFNERFRYADVCCDIAFLAMDLASSGSVELAEHLLAEYARHSNDFGLYPLIDFYESYAPSSGARSTPSPYEAPACPLRLRTLCGVAHAATSSSPKRQSGARFSRRGSSPWRLDSLWQEHDRRTARRRDPVSPWSPLTGHASTSSDWSSRRSLTPCV